MEAFILKWTLLNVTRIEVNNNGSLFFASFFFSFWKSVLYRLRECQDAHDIGGDT